MPDPRAVSCLSPHQECLHGRPRGLGREVAGLVREAKESVRWAERVRLEVEGPAGMPRRKARLG